MAVIPGMWRVELLHPLVVHFPIVLLLMGTLARVIGQFMDSGGRLGFLKPAGRTAIFIGAALSWLAVYTGDQANIEVARTLCDPRVKQVHEDLAHICAYTFSIAIIVDLAVAYFKPGKRFRVVLTTLALLAFVVGSGLLAYVGHLGARLVYQQGAAVYEPSEMCTEFSDPKY